LVVQAGDLIAQGDKLLGQGLEAAIVFHILLNPGRLFRRDALGELPAVKETLEDIIGAAPDGSGSGGFEKLFTQGTAPEPVDRLHLQEYGLPFLQKIVEIGFHGHIVSI